MGVGLRWQITRYFDGEIYWAKALRNVQSASDRDPLQDSGVHFRASLRY